MAYNLARRPLLVGGIPNEHEGFRIERMRARPPIRGAIRPGRGPKGGRRSKAHSDHVASASEPTCHQSRAAHRRSRFGSVQTRAPIGGQSTNQSINPVERMVGRMCRGPPGRERRIWVPRLTDRRAAALAGRWAAEGQVARRAGPGARRRRGTAGACHGSWREGATMTAQHRCGAQQQATRARRSSVARAWRRRGRRATHAHT